MYAMDECRDNDAVYDVIFHEGGSQYCCFKRSKSSVASRNASAKKLHCVELMMKRDKRNTSSIDLIVATQELFFYKLVANKDLD